MAIRLKREYETPDKQDGVRVLVDRVWPRGVGKAELAIDRWPKEIAPSTGLRKWSGHDAERWPELERRYFRELDRAPEALDELIEHARRKRVTLVFAARGEEHNNEVAVKLVGTRQVEAVELDDGSVVDADLVVIGVGVRPATGFLFTGGRGRRLAASAASELEQLLGESP